MVLNQGSSRGREEGDHLKLITLEYVRDDRRACYSADRLAALYDRPHTPLEVLTRTDGQWADVPAKDRLWTVLHAGVLPDKTLRLFACDCAERALTNERDAGREPDPRSWTAVEVARKYVIGQATTEDLATAAADSDAATATRAAARAARAAAYAANAAHAATAAARVAAHAANAAAYAANAAADSDAGDAAAAAAYYAATAAATAAANATAAAAAYAAERRWQFDHLVDMIQMENTGP